MRKKRKKTMLSKDKTAENAMKKIAEREGIPVESVRKHIQIAMLNGLCSNDPQVKAFWASIPRKGDVPTPEELIMYVSVGIKNRTSSS